MILLRWYVLVQVQTKFSSLSIDSLQISAQPAPLPAWPAPSPVEHLNYSLVPRVVDTKTYIFDTIWERFEALHVAAPSHPIFGEVAPGVLRAPFRARWAKVHRRAGCCACIRMLIR